MRPWRCCSESWRPGLWRAGASISRRSLLPCFTSTAQMEKVEKDRAVSAPTPQPRHAGPHRHAGTASSYIWHADFRRGPKVSRLPEDTCQPPFFAWNGYPGCLRQPGSICPHPPPPCPPDTPAPHPPADLWVSRASVIGPGRGRSRSAETIT